MPEWLVTFISKLKPSAITSCGVAIVCSLLLFMPHEFIVFLSLQEFVKEHRVWIGIAWLVSTSFCAIYLFKVLAPPITKLANGFRLKRSLTKKIRNLTSDQKTFLVTFRNIGWKEQRLNRNSAIVDELFQKYILVIPAGQIAHYGLDGSHPCLCYVSDWAREYIDKHPDCLEFLTEQTRKD